MRSAEDRRTGELGPERGVQTKKAQWAGCLCAETEGKRPGRASNPEHDSVVADCISFALPPWAKLTHFVAPPFKIEPAWLGFDLVAAFGG